MGGGRGETRGAAPPDAGAGRLRFLAGSSLYSVLVLAALALLLGLSLRFRTQWDLSAGRRNSLSPQSLEVLERVPEGTRIVALFTPQEPRRGDYWRLLQMYRLANPKLSVEVVDPVARPGIVQQLGLRGQGHEAQLDGLTVALHGQRRRSFRGVAEEDVTGALLDLLSDAPRGVGIVRGYGELDPDSRADGGFRSAVEALETEFYDVRDVTLAEEVPTDVTLLVLAGPRIAMPAADADRLARYLERGGRAIVLAEPGDEVSSINEVLARWGLRLGDLTVYDPKENVFGNPEVLLLTAYSGHTIVRGFGRSLPTVLPLARAVEHFEPGDPLVFHDDLVRSSPFAMGRAPDGTRRQGPFALAAASWRRIEGAPLERETRVVVVGDTSFATNLYFPRHANRNFFLNCVGWLAREQALVAVRRQVLEGQQILLGPGDASRIVLATLAAPALMTLVGIVVMVRRRLL